MFTDTHDGSIATESCDLGTALSGCHQCPIPASCEEMLASKFPLQFWYCVPSTSSLLFLYTFLTIQKRVSVSRWHYYCTRNGRQQCGFNGYARACVRACVRACMRTCRSMHVRVRAMCEYFVQLHYKRGVIIRSS